MATYSSNLDAKSNIGSGGGGGDDTYTAPNEYFVDPSLAADATKRQYQTIQAALSAGTTASDDPIVIRLAMGQNHTWDGTNLSSAPGDVIIYAVGSPDSSGGMDPTLTLDTASLTSDNGLQFKSVRLLVSTSLEIGVDHLVVEGCTGSLSFDLTDTPGSLSKTFVVKKSDLAMAITGTGSETSGGSFTILDSRIEFGGSGNPFWDHTADSENWSLDIEKSTLVCTNADTTFIDNSAGGGGISGSFFGGPLFRNVDFIVSGFGFGTLTILDADGSSGPLWVDCRITVDENNKSGHTFTFGDEGYQNGLEIVYASAFSDLPTDAPDGTTCRSNASPSYGQAVFDRNVLQWRGENRTVFLQGSSGAIPGIGVPVTLETVFEGDTVVDLDPSSIGTLYRIQGSIIVGRDAPDNGVWDVDWIVEGDSTGPTIVTRGATGTATLLYEGSGGQFTVSLDLVTGPPTGFSVTITKNSGSANVPLFAKLQITQEST